VKRIIKIVLFLSVGFNVFSIWAVIRIRNNKIQSEAFGSVINKTTWANGLELFRTKLKEKDKSCANKKYYYVNIWTNWCAPCIKEMPCLDSLAGTLRTDIGYIFVSDISEDIANSCIKKKNYHLKNFIFLNDMNDFISGICNEIKIKSKSYPMVLILDQEGEIYHYSVGTSENLAELKALATIIQKLP
jgi:thiol-disulfide isomerase/thioredoxin